VRPGTRHRVAAGAHVAELDVFSPAELASALKGRDTVLHLIGTAHPNPSKAKEFVSVDLASARACAAAAAGTAVGHRWPILLAPAYAIAECLPGLRSGAQRLGLVTLEQMKNALIRTIEHPSSPGERRIVDVPAIRASGTPLAP
jgi:hypothetical protein